MELCNQAAIHAMIRTGELRIEPAHGDIIFLDDFRVGLRLLDTASLVDAQVDLVGPNPLLRSFSLAEQGLQDGQWALGRSVEKLSIPANVLGIMNTRSKYARLGLEMMQSSWLAAPGFGRDEPTPVIFEMQARTRISGFSEDEPYAFLMLFALNVPVALDSRSYGMRFPLDAEGRR